MLPIPQDTNCLISVIGIDPGSTTLGVAVITFDCTTAQVVQTEAWTINAERLAGKFGWSEQMHGARASRLMAIEENLAQLFMRVQPLAIASESPFINNRFPQAGIALTEVICSIRNAVLRYDVWRQLYLIPPSTVKNAVGAKGGGDKNAVKAALLLLPALTQTCLQNPNELDEHSIDALACAYCIYQRLLSGLPT